ncbi:HlyD family efflux transporter periplasmic adaptor subunit [Chitinophaga sancti]|uniref:HlyD family secretion protein n=1 Tax=Chitinophaga sancti TaxID=1004 RepID=UPI002A75E6E6|nr:HlyD family efflux transporter periplasmic adaptor subunit [Chitinophaga sancti]WPQ60538.1 HlyD family efflux transporter periplasmic adaptor subunit [Chitinophaga sancti]
MKKHLIILILVAATLSACNNKEAAYDASGTFEAVETIVSAEASGNIKSLDVEEGQVLKAGQVVGYIDSIQLILKKKQLQAQISAVLSGRPDIAAQTAALQEQLRQAERERDRTENLLKADAATRKQLDDAVSQVAIVKKQIAATQSSLGITTTNLKDQAAPLQAQIQQIDDQLDKCRLTNPIDGTVLTKYAEAGEVTSPGKAVYKIAALNTIILRAYLTGNQLSLVKPGQQVKVLVDNMKDQTGTIEWISNKAEFTPKTIQTKDERANLVYAIKVRVNNDGYLKIGMYGEIKL